MSCVTHPAVPPTPGVPDRVARNIDLGWDATANSVITLDGPCLLTFTMQSVVGALVGLRGVRGAATLFGTFSHGFIFIIQEMIDFYAVVENGQIVTDYVQRPFVDVDGDGNPIDTFEIERVGSSVVYRVNSDDIRVAPTLFTNTATVSAVLFASGDEVA